MTAREYYGDALAFLTGRAAELLGAVPMVPLPQKGHPESFAFWMEAVMQILSKAEIYYHEGRLMYPVPGEKWMMNMSAPCFCSWSERYFVGCKKRRGQWGYAMLSIPLARKTLRAMTSLMELRAMQRPLPLPVLELPEWRRKLDKKGTREKRYC